MLRTKLSKNQGGFTLIELLVVIGILAILLAITLIAINPNKHFQDTRNAKRSSDVSAILDAIYEYQSANSGTLPPSVQSSFGGPVAVSSTSINLCDVVPTYLADLPMDPDNNPFTGSSIAGGSTPCNVSTTAYDTGYEITKTVNGRFTVSAPSAEGGASISVTR